MGWAKYYEDNMSIYVGRMALKESAPIYQVNNREKKKVVEKTSVNNIISESVIKSKNQKGRRGLELRFTEEPEKKILIKLSMNGWWWSNSNNCWCNLDTVGNRKYAVNLITILEAHLSTVNA